MRRRAAVLVALVVLGLGYAASPASAGGSWLTPERDRYEPGERVTLIGYTSGLGSLGALEDGPFFGSLRAEVAVPTGPNLPTMAPTIIRDSDLRLGEVTIVPTGKGGYLAYRASITFNLPADLRTGAYDFIMCNADCSKGFGDLIGGVVQVGTTGPYPPTREWALDDPAIVNLAGDARLSGPGYDITAAELRAGSIPTSSSTTATSSTTTSATVPSSIPIATSTRAPDGDDDGGRALVIAVACAIALSGSVLFVRRTRRRRLTVHEN